MCCFTKLLNTRVNKFAYNQISFQFHRNAHQCNNNNIISLHDSFSRSRVSVTVKPIMTMYCCGPTVYDYCHLGHALTYTRCDLFKRFLLNYYYSNLIVVMGITDIDDKILNKSFETKTDYQTIANTYLTHFMDDMKTLNIKFADCYTRVTDHISDIIYYIKRMQTNGFAYISDTTGDVNFDWQQFSQTFQLQPQIHGQNNQITDKSIGKKSPKDFALWKCAKLNEPFWNYISIDGQVIRGRPGWHVECSAMSNAILGDSIDLHFGGKDLAFPHHHCEATCCYAYHQLSDSTNLYNYSNVWLHSGHLIFKTEKMSKSLGNVITIKQFIRENSTNLLRLLCIRTHYRSDITYSDDFLNNIKEIDKKLLDFYVSLNTKIEELSAKNFLENKIFPNNSGINFTNSVESCETEIIEGIADDFDLNRGLDSILLLAKSFNSLNDFFLIDLIKSKFLINKWFITAGLQYYNVGIDFESKSFQDIVALNKLIKFRSNVRELALLSLQITKDKHLTSETCLNQIQNNSKSLLFHCDQLRGELDSYGFKIKDSQVTTVSTATTKQH